MEKNKETDKKQPTPPKLDQWRIIWGTPQREPEPSKIVIKWPNNKPGGKHGK